MDQSLGSTIEKIKREEQNKEAKLKAKREHEAAIAGAERAIRDTMAQIKKLQQEKMELVRKTDELHSQVTIHKVRRDALAAQLTASRKELESLQAYADQITLTVQEIRSSYCKVVQEVSDECDVWALLTKPHLDVLPKPTVNMPSSPAIENNDQTLINEQRLNSVIERRDKALAERERLNSEPDTSKDFIRIKNALRYSLEKTANLRKQIK